MKMCNSRSIARIEDIFSTSDFRTTIENTKLYFWNFIHNILTLHSWISNSSQRTR